jgi:hypothetical protein
MGGVVPSTTAEPVLATLRPGDAVDAVLACSRKDRLIARTGLPYPALALPPEPPRRGREERARARAARLRA